MKFQKKTVFIYEINGKEKITVTTAAEAKKWDDIFAVADKLDTVMQKNSPDFKMGDADRNDLCIYLARNKAALMDALKGGTDVIDVPEPAIPSSKDGFSL
ncbi:MAG: YebG family protein [Motiliproteus sp.]|nr:YebG family protein [Motiliproteus sp.]MCW9051490.1 YebG family protein [Motiliproteus sp.]